MLEQKLTKLQSKTDSVKGKKENQGLENLHAKQLLHLLSLHLLLMIPTLLFLFPLIDLITSFCPWYQGVFQFQKHVCILLIQVGCNGILLGKRIAERGNYIKLPDNICFTSQSIHESIDSVYPNTNISTMLVNQVI